nr:hypothetical protein [Candidatus Pseudomonas adelgestsugas]
MYASVDALTSNLDRHLKKHKESSKAFFQGIGR